MKLEKIITPYLPYDLKCQIIGRCLENEETPKTYTLTGIYKDSYNEVLLQVDYQGDKDECHKNDLLPILKPLKYVKKEINKFYEVFGGGFLSIKSFENYFINNVLLTPIELLSFQVVQFLIENHYDIYGLIDAGLAVDFYEVNK